MGCVRVAFVVNSSVATGCGDGAQGNVSPLPSSCGEEKQVVKPEKRKKNGERGKGNSERRGYTWTTSPTLPV